MDNKHDDKSFLNTRGFIFSLFKSSLNLNYLQGKNSWDLKSLHSKSDRTRLSLAGLDRVGITSFMSSEDRLCESSAWPSPSTMPMGLCPAPRGLSAKLRGNYSNGGTPIGSVNFSRLQGSISKGYRKAELNTFGDILS